jgi:Tfp pilus assembly protein PilV
MMRRLAFFAVLIALLGTAACQQDDVQLRLTSFERNRIDTLYAGQAAALRAQTDSLCQRRYAEWVQQAVDSIVQERLAEEEQLRSRIPIPR